MIKSLGDWPKVLFPTRSGFPGNGLLVDAALGDDALVQKLVRRVSFLLGQKNATYKVGRLLKDSELQRECQG